MSRIEYVGARRRRRPGRAGSAAAAASATGRGPRTGRTGTRCSRPCAAASTAAGTASTSSAPARRRRPPAHHSRSDHARTPPRIHAPRTSHDASVRPGEQEPEARRLLEVGDEQHPGDRGEQRRRAPPARRRPRRARGVAERDEQRGDEHRAGGDRLGDEVGRHLRAPRRRVRRRVRRPGRDVVRRVVGHRRRDRRVAGGGVGPDHPVGRIAVRSGSSAACDGPR